MKTNIFTGLTMRLIIKALFACFFVQFFIGCGNTPTKVDGASEQQSALIALDEIPLLLENAALQPEPEKTKHTLEICLSLLKHGEYDWARSVLAGVSALNIKGELFINHALISARLAEIDGRPFVAKRLLWEPKFERTLALLPHTKRIQAHEARATLLYNIAEYRNAIAERLALEQLITDRNQQELNQDLIWQNLMALPIDDLRMESQMQSDQEIRGWYTLAAISKDNQTNLARQLQQVDSWATNQPEHPASLRLPADLQLLRQLVEEQPQQIAVLLPLSGRLGKAAGAIRDGMLAAYYGASERATLPSIRFYDTENTDITQTYQSAISDGAQLVIGPLNKDNISTLAQQADLPVPTLALNNIDTISVSNNLYQFGLGVEDEASQVAERARQDGLQRAMIIAPKGEWGDRSVNTFSATWQQLGGQIVGDYRFTGSNDYSVLIKNAMHLNQSQQRRRDLQRRIGTRVEFEPRRRSDIDMIFLVAYPEQARQIKPTLAFHYAGHIPVYATSHIYNGQHDSAADRDMNAIRFTTLPWFFNEQLTEKNAIEKYANPNPAYQRLYALGVDVFHLYPRLRQLEQVKQAHFYGTTGAISLNSERVVVREQTWAQFVKGQAYAMPTTVYEDNTTTENLID